MTDTSRGQFVLIDPEELPNLSAIKGSVARLMKDAELLSRMRTNKDADPKDLKRVADFLEHLAAAYKKQFPRGEKDDVEDSDNSGLGWDSGEQLSPASQFIYEPKYK